MLFDGRSADLTSSCLQIVSDSRYKHFLAAFRTAVLLYVQGNWTECKDKLEECTHLKVRATTPYLKVSLVKAQVQWSQRSQ